MRVQVLKNFKTNNSLITVKVLYTVNLINNIMKYEIGQKVWVKPIDASDLEGIVIGFQKVEPYHPIVEAKYCGRKFKNAFDLDRINPFEKGKVEPIYIRLV